MEFEKGNIALAKRIQRDLEAHTRFKRDIERYWERLGHKVYIEIVFNAVNKVYTLRSDLKNCMPADKSYTARCSEMLLRFKAPSPFDV